MSNAVFHKDLLKNYQVLDRPGTFIVTVAYDVTDANLITKDDHPRYLVPLRVITGDNLLVLVGLLEKYNTIPYAEIGKLFVSGAIFDNGDLDTSTLPIKGERVVATFDYVSDKLLCTHIKLIDREDLFYVNYSKINALYTYVESLNK